MASTYLRLCCFSLENVSRGSRSEPQRGLVEDSAFNQDTCELSISRHEGKSIPTLRWLLHAEGLPQQRFGLHQFTTRLQVIGPLVQGEGQFRMSLRKEQAV